MDKLISNYMATGEYALYVLAGLVLILAFLGRNQLKILFSDSGYRNKLTDASFSEHQNSDTIYENEKVSLITGVNIKTVGYYFLMSITALVSPYITAVVYVKYKYSLVKSKFGKTKDFKLFEMNEQDDFINFLNEKSGKINLLVDEILISAYFIMILGLISQNGTILMIGLSIVFVMTLTLIGIFINAYQYKMNYKFLEFYQLLRLIWNSHLRIAKWDLVFLGVISLSTNFFGFQGFSTFFWIVFSMRFGLSLLLDKFIEREDNVNERHAEIENREYTVIEDVASYPNPKSQSRGYKFTSLLQMKFFELETKENGKDLIHLDNYAFYPQTINRTDLRKNPLLKETLTQSVKVYIEAINSTKQLLGLGGMGSGKTEMINYLVSQVHENKFNNYKSICFNDIKGDFTKRFYREDKDIIVNLYDKRAKVWCPFTEMNFNIEAGTSFISNLFESMAGEEKDFFSTSAKMKTSTWLQESFFATETNIEAWEMFFAKLSEYETDIKERDDKTQSSVLATIQIALEILQIMYFQIVEEKRETFSFYEFVHSEDVQLFLVNNKQYEAKLTPYLTGLMATYINTVMAKDDTKTHLIMNQFDEVLTMKLDKQTMKTLLTATRSKGFCNFLWGQYLPNDEKLIQDLDSSRYALITFNINDTFTLKKVSEKIAEAEILQGSSSPEGKKKELSGGGGESPANGMFALPALGVLGGGGGYKISYSLTQTKVILDQQLQSMPKYHHLTFIPSEEVKVIDKEEKNRFFRLMAFGYEKLMLNIAKKNDFLEKESGILYLGYTPQSNLSFDNNSFDKWDMKAFYDFKIAKENKDKKHNFDEKTIFKHWLKLKFSDDEKEVEDYILENNLYNLDIEAIFEEVEERAEKVLDLIARYTEIERYKLMDKFFDIPLDELDSKYDFCKEHDLIGGILGIFTFSDDFRNKLLNGEIEING